MRYLKILFPTIAILFATNAALGQTLLLESDVEKQQFGTDIFYKDQYDKPLEGHYKIADQRGNYSDIHFKNGKKHGDNTEYDYKGRILKKVTYKDGKAEGTYTTYHQNGNVRKQGEFVDGEEDGKWEIFDDKGKLEAKEQYKAGKKTGKWWSKKYYGQFQTYSYVTENYKDDILVGHAEEKGEDGILKWERDYTNDQTYTHKSYFPNGKLNAVRALKDGKLHGKKIKYSPDGVLISEMVFDMDQLQKSTRYFPNGNLREIYNYQHGKKDGQHLVYSEEGTKVIEGTYQDDYKTGIWKRYDTTSGQLLFETTFVDNVKNGIAIEYNEAKRISTKGLFKSGVKHEVWKHYSLAGNLVKEVTYDMGKEVTTKKYN